MKLQTLLASMHQLSLHVEDNPDILSIEMDSRLVRTGTLFICVSGYTVDGHDFASQAVEKGAVAIIAQRPLDVTVPVIIVKDSLRAMAVLADTFYGQPTHKLHLIGVTGTNGKTTTTDMMEQIFRHAQKKTGLIGTIGVKIGDDIYETKNTTPDSLALQKIFKEMVDKQVEVSAMEVSSHALQIGRVHGCDFDVAVFTNLTQDHLDFHQTMEKYACAKGLLFAQLGNSFSNKYAIFNEDDVQSEEYKQMTSATIVTYGIQKKSDIMAKNIFVSNAGMEFDLVTSNTTAHIKTRLVGIFNVYNMLAATAACLVSNVNIETIVQGLEKLNGVSGRFEVVDEGQDFLVIVDYSHTPDSLQVALETIREFAKKKVYVVVGCGGDRDKQKRPIMAQVAVRDADVAIFTADNPRSEKAEHILADMEAGVEGKAYMTIVNRREAIQYAVSHAETGDVILIAGKGHEMYQIIGANSFHFDDREEAREAIKRREEGK